MIKVEDVLNRITTKDGLEYYGVRFNSRGFAHCPFHQERTPSFHYDMRKDRFYCFSCHRGGTIIDFVAEYFNYNLPKELPKVLERIDKDFNLGLSRELTPKEKKAYKEDQKLNKIIQKGEQDWKASLNTNYDKWTGVYRSLYGLYLKEGEPKGTELSSLLEQLDEALNDFSGTALRAWPLQTLTEQQLELIEQAFEQDNEKVVSFQEFTARQEKQRHIATETKEVSLENRICYNEPKADL